MRATCHLQQKPSLIVVLRILLNSKQINCMSAYISWCHRPVCMFTIIESPTDEIEADKKNVSPNLISNITSTNHEPGAEQLDKE